jgi:hypothetical protein
MNSPEAFQICPARARSNQRKKRDEYCGKLERLLSPASDGSLLFGTWRGLGFADAAMCRSFLVRNILAEKLKTGCRTGAVAILTGSETNYQS